MRRIGVGRRPRGGAAVGAARVGGEERLEIAVGDERVDLAGRRDRVGRTPVTATGRRGRARRSAARDG